MGQNSKIEWTHHTFNPWWGCVRVSPACKHCYADSWAQRLGLSLWGEQTDRRFFSDAHWRDPLKWDRDAAREGGRRRVFCASMADVFEDRADLNPWRERLWGLIEATPNLDWLLLTKRPDCIGKLSPWKESWPSNIWLGTTVENNEWAEKRLSHLLKWKATVRFVSCEPLLGELDLEPWLMSKIQPNGINWVIAGGESGAKARPMNPEWAEQLRDQCRNSDIPFHFKQWGHWGPASDADRKAVQTVEFLSSNGRTVRLSKLGKHATGRLLDGRTWDGFPRGI